MYVKEHTHLVCLDVCLFVFLSYLYIDLDLTSIFPLVYQSKIFALIIICLSHTNTHTHRGMRALWMWKTYLFIHRFLYPGQVISDSLMHTRHCFENISQPLPLWVFEDWQLNREHAHTHSFRWSWWYCLLPPLRQSFDFLPIPFSLGWKRSSFWRQFVCCCRLMFL